VTCSPEALLVGCAIWGAATAVCGLLVGFLVARSLYK